jgi:hypothetical protein
MASIAIFVQGTGARGFQIQKGTRTHVDDELHAVPRVHGIGHALPEPARVEDALHVLADLADGVGEVWARLERGLGNPLELTVDPRHLDLSNPRACAGFGSR